MVRRGRRGDVGGRVGGFPVGGVRVVGSALIVGVVSGVGGVGCVDDVPYLLDAFAHGGDQDFQFEGVGEGSAEFGVAPVGAEPFVVGVVGGCSGPPVRGRAGRPVRAPVVVVGSRSSPGRVRVRGGSVYRCPVGLDQSWVWSGPRVLDQAVWCLSQWCGRHIGSRLAGSVEPPASGCVVVVGVAMVQVAAPGGLSAGREPAGGGQGGGDVAGGLGGSVGACTGAGDAAGGGVEQHGGDGGGGFGDHQRGGGGDGAVALEVAGEPVEPGEGGRGQGDGQVRAASLSGGAARGPTLVPVPGAAGVGAGRRRFWLVAAAGRAWQMWCRRRCRASGGPGVGRREVLT